MIRLPPPRLSSGISVEEALRARRSQRSYLPSPLALEEVAQLLWAAYGITKPPRYKTAPSAGATYPLAVYLVSGEVEGLEPGSYKYLPEAHALVMVRRGDLRPKLYEASLRQPWVLRAPASLVLGADFGRTTSVYGKRGIRYVWMEFGHASQNVYLQAVSLGLGTVAVAAFYDEEVKAVVGMEEDPGYVMPVGRARHNYSPEDLPWEGP
ncbi:MAG: SagB/ThcOx family dehydrogenase [Crenarchaeota archaeon]|nr:SagB/ThcOx family dehydrogenase [Thermoproteota archaeon]